MLLIEVSDSTLNFDRTRKMRLYAAYNIPEYWIINLLDNNLEVYRQPQDGDYLQTMQLKAGDTLNLISLPDLQIQVSAIL